MAGIEERVRNFLETWRKLKAGEIPDPESATCTECGTALGDGNFALVDGDLVCLSCKKGLQEK